MCGSVTDNIQLLMLIGRLSVYDSRDNSCTFYSQARNIAVLEPDTTLIRYFSCAQISSIATFSVTCCDYYTPLP